MEVALKLLDSHGKKATQECFFGNLGNPRKACTCMPSMVSRYRKRISGPLLDRIDIFVDVHRWTTRSSRAM